VAASALERAEAARNIDLNLYHAEGPFGFVVGKGPVRLPEEGQDGLFVSPQAIQEVLGLGLFEALAGLLFGREGISRPTTRADRFVASAATPRDSDRQRQSRASADNG
jgi:hypothetical protein